MAEIFQNREKNIGLVGIYIAKHCMQFSCIAQVLEHPIADVYNRSMWLGLHAGDGKSKRQTIFSGDLLFL